MPAKRPSRTAVALGAVSSACAGYYAKWSLLLHRSYHSNGWDLGIIDQVVWNTAHGRWFEYSFRDISYAGDHWQPILLFLVPLKWFWHGPESLLIVQAAALGAATIPLFVAARRLIGYEAGAWAAVVAYALGLGVTRAVAFDFHAEAFVPLLAFTALWALATSRSRWFLASSLAVLLVKEDSLLLALSLAWIAAVAFGQPRPALVVAGAALAYGAIVNIWLIPHFRGGDLNPLAERFGYLGESVPEIAFRAATRPDLVASQLWQAEIGVAVLWLLLGVVALPLLAPKLAPGLLLVTLPPLLSQDESQPRLELHYMVVPATVALVVAILVLGNRSGRNYGEKHLRAATALLALASVAIFAWQSPLPPSFAAELERFDVDRHARASDAIVALVPPGEVVSAQSPFVPHLAERRKIYQFPRVLDAEFVITDQYGPVAADDVAAGHWSCLEVLPGLGFEVVREDDGVSLWRRRRPADPDSSLWAQCSGILPRN